ncbi:sel1 repeat family protein [Roseibium denhamense]|uniref:Sel1 repeat family protein n=1 Tax=Roseibium denhamense TaxID=76305 RepID=A0ABY1NKT9_9HYPH|nr:tetratricopeptide repeat protein [Roseibium denhamense]MTI06793.1 sel1 repeat family protein [Roseibium denhamense]SMP11388.1 hypothetical protein SAMN06265374_1320 [Roseibium denhamense]
MELKGQQVLKQAAMGASCALSALVLAAGQANAQVAPSGEAGDAPAAAVSEAPLVRDYTTTDKTLKSIVDVGPPRLSDGEQATAVTAYSAFQRGWYLTALAIATPLAEQNDVAAQALLGVLHEAGLGIRQDKAKAADWYSLAAASGDNGSALQLAQLYLAGDGVDENKSRAADLFEQAAQTENASALYNLAIIYQEGEGRPFNEQKARDLLVEAAQLNDPEAQYALALSFLEVQGDETDARKGAFWMGRAARRGHSSAQVYYGILRFQGKGVEPDREEAADWFERAARAGNPVGMNRLARIYAYGEGRAQNNTAAAGWHLIARTLGVSDRTLDGLVGTLDDETLANAQKLAQQYSTTLMAPTANPARESP